MSGRVGKEIGVDPETILETSHGRRSMDMLKILAPEKANWECKYPFYEHPLLSSMGATRKIRKKC